MITLTEYEEAGRLFRRRRPFRPVEERIITAMPPLFRRRWPYLPVEERRRIIESRIARLKAIIARLEERLKALPAA